MGDRFPKARISSILNSHAVDVIVSEDYLLRLGLFYFKLERRRVLTRKQCEIKLMGRQCKIEGSLTGIRFSKAKISTISTILTRSTSFARKVCSEQSPSGKFFEVCELDPSMRHGRSNCIIRPIKESWGRMVWWSCAETSGSWLLGS